MGSNELVVDPGAILTLGRMMPNGRVTVFEGARHELLMERPEVRDAFLASAVALFETARATA